MVRGNELDTKAVGLFQLRRVDTRFRRPLKKCAPYGGEFGEAIFAKDNFTSRKRALGRSRGYPPDGIDTEACGASSAPELKTLPYYIAGFVA